LEAFQDDATKRFTPAMQQRIGTVALYERAHRVVRKMRINGRAPAGLSAPCRFISDDLPTLCTDKLVEKFVITS